MTTRTHTLFRLTGPQLAILRRKTGLTQTALAQAAGIGRHAVSYWETKPVVSAHQHAPRRMLAALGIKADRVALLPANTRAHARGDGVLSFEQKHRARKVAQRTVRAPAAALAEPCAQGTSCEPTRCGAQTRKGQPCRMPLELGRTRCKFHGGRSTGPRTPEGRARIAEAQRRRWATWKAGKPQEEAAS